MTLKPTDQHRTYPPLLLPWGSSTQVIGWGKSRQVDRGNERQGQHQNQVGCKDRATKVRATVGISMVTATHFFGAEYNSPCNRHTQSTIDTGLSCTPCLPSWLTTHLILQQALLGLHCNFFPSFCLILDKSSQRVTYSHHPSIHPSLSTQPCSQLRHDQGCAWPASSKAFINVSTALSWLHQTSTQQRRWFGI